MAGENEGLVIPLSFTLEEGKAALKEIERAAREAGIRIQEGLGGGGTASQKGGFFALKEGAGRARESVMFLTSSLGEFGESGRRAQGVITGIAGAFLGGGPLLLGMEAARFAISAISDAWEAEAKAEKAAAEAARAETEKASAAWMGRVSATRGWLDSLRDQRDQLAGVSAGWAALTRLIAERDQETNGARRGAIQARIDEGRAILMQIDALKEKAREEAAEKDRAEGRKREAADKAAAAAKALAGQRQFTADVVSAVEREKTARMTAADEAYQHEVAVDRLRVNAEAFRVAEGNAARAAEIEAVFLSAAKETQIVNDSEWAGVITSEEAQARRTAILQDQSERRKAILEAEKRKATELALEGFVFEKRLKELGVQSARGWASSVAGEFGKMTSSSRAYNKAMRAAGGATQESADLSAAAFMAFTQNALSSVSTQATADALYFAAKALAFSAIPGFQGSASALWIASGEMAAVAALTGGGAMAIGAGRGMTRAERSAVASAAESNRQPADFGGGAGGLSSGSGAREVGLSPSLAPVVTREIILVIGDPFEAPAETARRAARTMKLAGDLNMVRRSA